MRVILTVTFLCCVSHFAAAQSDSVSINFIQILNQLRNDPRSFESAIDEYYYEWRSFVTNRKGLEKAIKEIKQRLRTQSRLPTLTPDTNLLKAALDHANDSYNKDVVGHIGSDGSNPGSRVKRYSSIENVAECITYGQKTSRLMLAALLIDEGNPSRGHRESLLSAQYSLIGVAVAPHPRYHFQCVVVLGSK
jgi:uncharacterized protein YkwD